MKWASTLQGQDQGSDQLGTIVEKCARRLAEELAGSPVDLAVGFISPHFFLEFDRFPGLVKRCLNAATFIGCSAGGLIGGGQEVEHEPAVALTAAHLPGVQVMPFHLLDEDLPDLDDPPSKWERIVGVTCEVEPAFILLPDPFTVRVDALVQGLDFAFPKLVKLGGLASGATRPGLNALFIDEKVLRSGAVGVALSGDISVEAVVAQGCRPIGRPMRVSNCDRNVIYELDGQPAVAALHEVLINLSEYDQELARTSLFLGVVMDEFKEDFRPGDFLIRNIIGLEPNTGALVVGELLRNERTVQFHLRDAATSAEDLRFMLKRYRDAHEATPAGALLFSCLGRGRYLYGQPNHDSDCFKEYVGEIPLGGFFCNGEIGPVSGTTFLHGYTSCFGIFRPKAMATTEHTQ